VDAGSGLSFDNFLDVLGPLLWLELARERARQFHGGRPCPQHAAPRGGVLCVGAASCPEDCASAYSLTALRVWSDLCRARASGDGRAVDVAGFVRAHARSRFLDVLRAANHAEHGHLTRVRRSVEQALWIDHALGGDQRAKRLLVDVIFYLQSDDPPEPGSPLPYGRLAADRGTDEQAIAAEIRAVLARLETANLAWVDQHVYRLLGRQLARHGVPTELLDVAHHGDEDAHEHAVAYRILEDAARHAHAGIAPGPALQGLIAERLGRSAARRATASHHWPALVAAVTALAAELDQPGAA
jgi:hypothetical protein